MTKPLFVLAACLWIGAALAADSVPPPETSTRVATAGAVSESKKIETELQHLPWEKFRLIIESVPKMKADVDAYGVLGWSYVQANYQTYAWHKSIDRLDATQRRCLVAVIQLAQGVWTKADMPCSKPD